MEAQMGIAVQVDRGVKQNPVSKITKAKKRLGSWLKWWSLPGKCEAGRSKPQYG
jgi:hypothetical protein